MPRKPESLSLDEKIRIAIGVLALESFEKPNAAKMIAEQFDIATRSATALRNQAYEAIKAVFLPKASSDTEEADVLVLMRGLNKVVGSPAAKENEVIDDVVANLGEIWHKIQDYNSRNERKIYPSASVLAKIAGVSSDVSEAWLTEHQEEVDSHIEKFNLTPVMNRGKRDIASILGYDG